MKPYRKFPPDVDWVVLGAIVVILVLIVIVRKA
jgi:hypothetical protein